MHAATGIRDAGSRAYTLVRLLPYVDQPTVVEAALSVPDPEDRARRLLEVAAVLPEGDRAAALGSAWAAVVTMPPGLGQAVVFKDLVSLLPPG